MKTQGFIVTPETYGRALNVVGTKVTVLASNLETEGCEITLQQGDEGTGLPPHQHDWAGTGLLGQSECTRLVPRV